MAPVTKPLLSIGEECDHNKLVVFGRSGGAILNLEDGTIRRFPRVRGSYEMEMWIPPLRATLKRVLPGGDDVSASGRLAHALVAEAGWPAACQESSG